MKKKSFEMAINQVKGKSMVMTPRKVKREFLVRSQLPSTPQNKVTVSQQTAPSYLLQFQMQKHKTINSVYSYLFSNR